MHIGTRYVILAKHYMWLPYDGFIWTETCWSSFYNFNHFNNLRILWFVCISCTIKCLILLMHGATRKFMYYIIKLYPKLSAISNSSVLFHIFLGACSVVEFSDCLHMSWSSLLLGQKKVSVKDIHTSVFVYVCMYMCACVCVSKGSHFDFSSDQCIIPNQWSLFRNNVVTKFWKQASIVNLYSSYSS